MVAMRRLAHVVILLLLPAVVSAGQTSPRPEKDKATGTVSPAFAQMRRGGVDDGGPDPRRRNRRRAAQDRRELEAGARHPGRAAGRRAAAPASRGPGRRRRHAGAGGADRHADARALAPHRHRDRRARCQGDLGDAGRGHPGRRPGDPFHPAFGPLGDRTADRRGAGNAPGRGPARRRVVSRHRRPDAAMGRLRPAGCSPPGRPGAVRGRPGARAVSGHAPPGFRRPAALRLPAEARLDRGLWQAAGGEPQRPVPTSASRLPNATRVELGVAERELRRALRSTRRCTRRASAWRTS